MSIPKRHHYVPRVHLNKFEGENGFFILFKKTGKIIQSNSSADFFLKKELNTIGDENGEKDHVTFEKELDLKWDSQFNIHYDHIVKNKFSPENINQESLKYFFEYALITRMRRGKMESLFNENFLSFKEGIPEIVNVLDNEDFTFEGDSEEVRNGFRNLINMFSAELEKMENRQRKVKFPGLIPSEAKVFVPDKCVFRLLISHDETFTLPDSGGMIEKSKETFEWNSNTTHKLSFVVIPLNPTLLLTVFDAELYEGMSSTTFWCSEEDKELLNRNSVRYAYDQVLSSNRSLLEEIKDAGDSG